jgi:ankyrin repeat protein
LLLKTGAKEAILNEKDESYGNTPLHVACSLHSFGLIKLLILAGSDLSVTNLAGKTPVQVVNSEIETYLGYVDSNNSDIRDKTLARL